VKRHLNTLFVATQNAYLAKDGDCVLVRVDKETRLRVPVHTLDGIVCFGRVSCSPFLLGLCGRQGVAVTFLSRSGRFLARVVGPTSGNVLLRREQYRRAESHKDAAQIARAVVAAKIANSRAVLMRGLRDHPHSPGADTAERSIRRLHALLDQLQHPLDLESIRGVEGDAARAYFGAFDALITAQRQAFPFAGRSRRPPLDNVNALLSFVYTLLVHDVRSALEAVGLDPQVGFLHRDRPGRPSLALDLMEEFRAVLADRLALSLINLKQIQPANFHQSESGAVRLNDQGRKTVILAWQKRKQQELRHPFLDESTTFGMMPHLQARLLARHLRGDLDAYPAFFWK